jgi:hypothetical protein
VAGVGAAEGRGMIAVAEAERARPPREPKLTHDPEA